MKRLIIAIGLILTVTGILIGSLSSLDRFGHVNLGMLHWVLSLGLILLFSGFGLIAYGVKPPLSSQRRIFLGYVFAALGGMGALFIGKYILEDCPDEQLHGKVILALGIVTFIAFVLLWFLL